MQRLSEIKEILRSAGLKPQKRFGQHSLIDKNLMAKVLELAEPARGQTILEVGPGTGSLTEELLDRGCRVVAVEVDRGLCEQLDLRLGDSENLLLICGDVLAGKHAISPQVLSALGREAVLVANLPYNIAVPLIAECLLGTWRAIRGADDYEKNLCRFESLTFTVQRELADRITAEPGSAAYGQVSVLVAILGAVRLGPALPPLAFWPRPKVASRIVRIDFDEDSASRIADIDVMMDVLALAFGHRRKQIGSVFRGKAARFPAEAATAALAAAGIDKMLRAEQIAPEAFVALANALADDRDSRHGDISI